MHTVTQSPITVLIPTFNRGKYIAECLDSILNQTLPATQIIVVNDGSTDNTKEVLEPYAGCIDYFETEQLGKPGALNFGLGKVTGDYIWIFDDDDVALFDALERLVHPLERNPEAGFTYCTFLYSETDNSNNRIGKIVSEFRVPDLETHGVLIPLLMANYLGGAALFARSVCYREVGLFDPKLFRSQDYEMAIRIVRRFTGIRLEGGPTFYYRQHGGMRGASSDRFDPTLSNRKWLMYDQIFFPRLYRDIPLGDYLPPGKELANHERLALLQRISVMASKSLIPEMVSDLHEIALLKNQDDCCPEEYAVIRETIFHDHYSGSVNIYSFIEFFDEIRYLSGCSRFIRALRNKVFRAIVARFKSEPSGTEALGVIKILIHLYLRSSKRRR